MSYGAMTFANIRSYLFAALFIVGNVVLPQLFHTLPQGGVTWLPIYFFTLIGAYACGWHVGMLTALLSPTVNYLLFGMPALAVLPAIMAKSVILAVVASYAATRTGRATIWRFIAIVFCYQALGTLCEWAITGNLSLACQDLQIGLPGMLMQIIGGYAIVRILLHR